MVVTFFFFDFLKWYRPLVRLRPGPCLLRVFLDPPFELAEELPPLSLPVAPDSDLDFTSSDVSALVLFPPYNHAAPTTRLIWGLSAAIIFLKLRSSGRLGSSQLPLFVKIHTCTLRYSVANISR